MFARFDENPAMNLQDIKETKRYGRTDERTHGQRENSIPPTNKVCGGYNKCVLGRYTYFYPHAFLKKASGILQSPPSVTLSPPKPLDKI